MCLWMGREVSIVKRAHQVTVGDSRGFTTEREFATAQLPDGDLHFASVSRSTDPNGLSTDGRNDACKTSLFPLNLNRLASVVPAIDFII